MLPKKKKKKKKKKFYKEKGNRIKKSLKNAMVHYSVTHGHFCNGILYALSIMRPKYSRA